MNAAKSSCAGLLRSALPSAILLTWLEHERHQSRVLMSIELPPRVDAVDLVRILQRHRFDLSTEKRLQAEVAKVLAGAGICFEREKHLSDSDIPDFVVEEGIVIECKMRGARKIDVYKQTAMPVRQARRDAGSDTRIESFHGPAGGY